MPWGRLIQFTATVSDAEDAVLAEERLVWTSSHDGRLGQGSTIWTSRLSPGAHRITFSATDSGGLTASDEHSLRVANNTPSVVIESPLSSGSYHAGVPITFRGRAQDREAGNLTESLAWTSDVSGPLGSGSGFQAMLPAGRHQIGLSASDGALAARAEEFIVVADRPGGNAPPGVTITAPPHRSAPVGDRPEDCITLTAEAFDAEDGPLHGDALVWQDWQDGEALPRTMAKRGECITACGFTTAGGDTWHSITVTATDSAGATASNSIRILVIGSGLF